MLKTFALMAGPLDGEPRLWRVHERFFRIEFDGVSQETRLWSRCSFDASNGHVSQALCYNLVLDFADSLQATLHSALEYAGLVRRPEFVHRGRLQPKEKYELVRDD